MYDGTTVSYGKKSLYTDKTKEIYEIKGQISLIYCDLEKEAKTAL